MIETSVTAAFVLFLAIGFTYVEDWCHEHKRPEWLCMGAEGLSVLLFITDAIAVAGMALKLMKESVTALFK